MGLTFDKVLIILVIAAFLIGPERLPGYAEKFGAFVRRIRGFADTAKDRVKEEMGDDFSADDWKKLDPRQYDPRRIVRTALLDSPKPVAASGPAAAAAVAAAATAERASRREAAEGRPLAVGETAPFDTEAT